MNRPIFGDDHLQFRASVYALLKRELQPHQETFRKDGAIGRSLWRALGDVGMLGFMVPTEFGGAGVRDFRFNAVLGEELVRYGLAYGSSIGINTDVVSAYLLDLTTIEQKKRWLPAFAAGRLVTAIGMTEPGGGSDLAGLRTTVVPDGSSWLLSGSKTFITNGCSADLVIVAARAHGTTGKDGIGLFVVEEGMAGFARGPRLDKVGQSEADTSELFFENVIVPARNVLAPPGDGFRAMMERLPQERLSCAVVNVAHASYTLADAVHYAKERFAFGQAIGSFQSMRFLLAGLATELDSARALVDQCIAAHVNGRLEPVDAAKAKLWSSEVQGRVVDACVQVMGGYGYMNETPAARAWLDARVTRIWGGTSEIMHEVIGRSMGL